MKQRKRKRARQKKQSSESSKPVAKPTVADSREAASNLGDIEVARLEISRSPEKVQIAPQRSHASLPSKKRTSSLKVAAPQGVDTTPQQSLVPLRAMETFPVLAESYLEVDAQQENLAPLSEIEATLLETEPAQPEATIQERPLCENTVRAGATPGDGNDLPKEMNQSYTQTRIIEVSAADLRRSLVVAALEDDIAAAPSRVAYKMLRTQVLQRMAIKGWNTLGLTSPGPSQGKTLTAVNLAVTIAKEEQHTVMLVDLDLRRPSIYQFFNYAPEKGVEDFFLNDTPLDQILFNPGLDRLVVLPCKSPVVGSSELMASPKMAQFVHELKNRYPSRYILFDLPPMLAGDDVLAFAPHLDTMLMVIKHGNTSKKELKHTMDLLGDVDILGTVLNDCNEQTGSYYYYY